MVARVNTVAFRGIDVVDVDAQVQMAAGLPAFTVVGRRIYGYAGHCLGPVLTAIQETQSLRFLKPRIQAEGRSRRKTYCATPENSVRYGPGGCPSALSLIWWQAGTNLFRNLGRV